MEQEFSAGAFDGLQFVSQSPVRVTFLLELADNGPMSRYDLREAVDASRTTVSRNLDALVARGWVTEAGTSYRATPGGELRATALESYLSTAEAADRLEPFFRWFPADDAGVEWEWFLDADVYPSTSADPYAPVDRHAERLKTAERLYGLLPQVGLRPMQSIGRERGDFEHELVVSPSVAETLRSEQKYVEERAALDERGSVTFYVSEEPIRTYVGLFEDDVQIGVSDEGGVPRALVETDDERVRRWARETYERHRTDAEPLA
jgi:biotin operon repressor